MIPKNYDIRVNMPRCLSGPVLVLLDNKQKRLDGVVVHKKFSRQPKPDSTGDPTTKNFRMSHAKWTR